MAVDAAGKPSDFKIVSEDPAGIGLGPAALKAYGGGGFVPGYRNGKAVACRTTLIHYVNNTAFMTQ